jgi:tetratricopeptide (TPR) repeat protein
LVLGCGALVLACGGPKGAPPTTAQRLNSEGLLRLERGDSATADDMFRDAIAEAELVDDLKSQAEAWNNRGGIAFLKGSCDGAVEAHSIALRLHALRRVRDEGELRTRVNLANVLVTCGKREEARPHLREAEALAAKVPKSKEAVAARVAAATLQLSDGNAQGALGAAGPLVEDARKLEAPGVLAAALALSAEVKEASGDLAGARVDAEEALELDRKREAPPAVATDLRILARVHERLSDAATASALWLRYARIERRLGNLDEATGGLGRARELAARAGAAVEARAIAEEERLVRAAQAEAALRRKREGS